MRPVVRVTSLFNGKDQKDPRKIETPRFFNTKIVASDNVGQPTPMGWWSLRIDDDYMHIKFGKGISYGDEVIAIPFFSTLDFVKLIPAVRKNFVSFISIKIPVFMEIIIIFNGGRDMAIFNFQYGGRRPYWIL